jgi:hypothetical protein
MSRSEPTIVVTCDHPDGCNSREEVVLKGHTSGFVGRNVDDELARRGWMMTANGRDFCEDCAAKAAGLQPRKKGSKDGR